MTHIPRVAFPIAMTLALILQIFPAAAQDPPDGEANIGVVRQPIVAGDPLTPDEQRALGLVTVAGGCSGTMLNRFWVLTARHCVTNDPPNSTSAADIASPLFPEASLVVTAAWAPGQSASITQYREVGVNAAPAMPTRDIILLYLGRGDFGRVNGTIPFITQRGPTTVARWVGQRLTETDVVLLYGRGRATLASGTFGTASAMPAAPGGPYRSAVMQASAITETGFDMVPNASGQIGHAGDSGGGAIVFENGLSAGIAGIQSTCVPAGWIPSANPANPTPQTWTWANGIASCRYVSTQPFVREIGRAMQISPLCTSASECAAWWQPVLSYLTD